jgi:hypothetical protein
MSKSALKSMELGWSTDCIYRAFGPLRSGDLTSRDQGRGGRAVRATGVLLDLYKRPPGPHASSSLLQEDRVAFPSHQDKSSELSSSRRLHDDLTEIFQLEYGRPIRPPARGQGSDSRTGYPVRLTGVRPVGSQELSNWRLQI